MKRISTWSHHAGAFALVLLAGLAMLTIVNPGRAMAASAVTLANLNLRAGPGTVYPVVRVLPPNVAVTIYGCNAGTTWCDVGFARDRGWVSASYLQVMYKNRPVVVTPAVVPAVGLTVVTYNQAYWNAYYVGRPWYGQWNTYYRRAGGGCNDNGCGGAVAGPRGAAIGGCNEDVCRGATVRRTPYGPVVHRGTVTRN